MLSSFSSPLVDTLGPFGGVCEDLKNLKISFFGVSTLCLDPPEVVFEPVPPFSFIPSELGSGGLEGILEGNPRVPVKGTSPTQIYEGSLSSNSRVQGGGPYYFRPQKPHHGGSSSIYWSICGLGRGTCTF
jgi:hypothetical protein